MCSTGNGSGDRCDGFVKGSGRGLHPPPEVALDPERGRRESASARTDGRKLHMLFWIEFAMVLTAILLGIRRGGIALGLIGGLGVALLVFLFRAPPSEPPIAVMLIILAVVTASATLQVAGGLDYLVQLTERLLRAHPNRVTFLAPLCTFFLTVCVGTGHAVYALFPVIADVALKTRIRPERPMAVSSVCLLYTSDAADERSSVD